MRLSRLPVTFTLLATLLAALLAACQVTVTPVIPPTADYQVNAQGQTTEPSPRRTITVPANGVAVVEVRFPTSGADLMYVEIEPTGSGSGLQLELWNPSGTSRELVSRSASIFGTSTGVLAAEVAAAASERSSISIGWTCFGPCAARPYRVGTSYVRIVNDSSSSRTVRFYAYGLVATDQNEPNDSAAQAARVVATALGSAVTGAIEHVNDRDYFQIECGAGFPYDNLELELASGFAGEIALVVGGTNYREGQTTPLLPCNSIVHVRTLDGTAGPSSTSTYSIILR